MLNDSHKMQIERNLGRELLREELIAVPSLRDLTPRATSRRCGGPCSLVEVHDAGTDHESTLALPTCAPASAGAHGNTPCWYLEADAARCGATAAHLKLVADYGAASPPKALLRLSCVAP